MQHTSQTTQKRKRVSPDINKDSILLGFNAAINKWFAVYSEPVSLTYWEYILDRDIVFGESFTTTDGLKTKLIRIGEAIN